MTPTVAITSAMVGISASSRNYNTSNSTYTNTNTNTNTRIQHNNCNCASKSNNGRKTSNQLRSRPTSRSRSKRNARLIFISTILLPMATALTNLLVSPPIPHQYHQQRKQQQQLVSSSSTFSLFRRTSAVHQRHRHLEHAHVHSCSRSSQLQLQLQLQLQSQNQSQMQSQIQRQSSFITKLKPLSLVKKTPKLYHRLQTQLHLKPKYIELFSNDDPTEDDIRRTNEENSLKWLTWMTTGTVTSSSSSSGSSTTERETEEIKMRDPIALGGLPRSERYASRDWLHNTINMPNSMILQSVRFPVVFMTIWGFTISLLHRSLQKRGFHDVAMKLCIPTAPHSLMVSALGLLLVFRTNSAYQRFSEGRKIWEDILSTARDLSRLMKLYKVPIGKDKLRRLNRLLAAFPYLLRFRIRPNSIMKRMDDPEAIRDPESSLILYQDHAISDSDPEAAELASDEETTGISRRKPRELYWVDKRTLPWRLLPDKAMEQCARAQNRPLWVCDRMSKELHVVPDSDIFTARERLALLAKVDKLSATIGACERIHQTVVPLNYARHALRSLTMWLLSLPFSLVKDLGLMTGPTLFLISWMLFGVYEIGYSIEDPFQGTLRLSILCDAIRRDVLGDELTRNTAFTLDTEDTKSVKKKKVELETQFYEDDDYDDNLEEDEDLSIDIEEIVIDETGNIVNVTEAIENISDNDLVNGNLLLVNPQSTEVNGSVVQKKEIEKQPSISP